MPEKEFVPGTVPSARAGGAETTGGMLSSVRNWFQKQDPNFWSILAGAIAQSAPPGSWQHQLGGVGTGIARGQIMAKAMEKQKIERRGMFDQLMKAIGGGKETSLAEPGMLDLGQDWLGGAMRAEVSPTVPKPKAGRGDVLERLMGGAM